MTVQYCTLHTALRVDTASPFCSSTCRSTYTEISEARIFVCFPAVFRNSGLLDQLARPRPSLRDPQVCGTFVHYHVYCVPCVTNSETMIGSKDDREWLLYSHSLPFPCSHSHALTPSPLIDNIWAMMVVWRQEGRLSELFGAVLCTESCAQS